MSRRREKETAGIKAGEGRRGILLAILLLIVLVGSGSAAGLIAAQGSEQGVAEGRRNTGVVPRTIDVWAVYPDESLRLVSVYHPPAAAAGETVEIAGPLIDGEEAVTAHGVFGADLVSLDYPEGPDHDAELVYPRFTVQRGPGNAAYGVDVTVSPAPYLTADPTIADGYILSLGLKQPGYYQQMVVAVALPPGTTVSDTPGLQPYRQARVAGWDVFYFDVTDVGTEADAGSDTDAAQAIRLAFTFPAEPATPTLRWRRIDAMR